MSDIPPDLLEEFRKSDLRNRSILRRLIWAVVATIVIGFVVLSAPCARAASFDYGSVYCEIFAQGSDGRYYIQDDPLYTPSCSYPWVVLPTGKFRDLVAAYEGGSSSPSSPQFTADEVAALKFQAANPSPFNLSVEDGSYISGAIVGVWVIAWSFRQLKAVLRSDGEALDR